jgi:glutamate:GABA antiporter
MSEHADVDSQTPRAPGPTLRRELGLRDLTLFGITCIVGMRWIPAAARAGPGSVTLLVLAAIFFVVPLAIAVAALTVKYPGAGGFYLWTRGDFGAWHAFLCFWVYWMGIAFWFPSAAMFYMNAAISTLGPSYAFLAENRVILVGAALVAVWIALVTNMIGMRIGKWTENVGGAATWILGALLVTIAFLVWKARGSATPIRVIPTLNFDTLSFWATIAYAMTGLELVGLMGAEIHDPERTLPRAGWMASIFAALFYAATTLALLVLLPPERISELTGLAVAGETASAILGVAWLAPVIALLLVVTGVGQFGGLGTSTSRLPFAVGADHLLPKAFARVHPRWGTPHVSILALGVVASILLLCFQLGDTMRAAYQELVSLMVINGFLPFIYIFGSAWKAGRRWSAISGWGITALALVCSVVPTAEIANVWLFEAKLAAGTLAAVGSAWLLYRRASPRKIAASNAILPSIQASK